jgi:uroporphyrinogen III methyltransferase/synthase
MTVYLVGAGPGDPDLLTLRALRLIRSADVVIHDRLVHPLVLGMAPEGAVVIDAGKRRGRAKARQEEIHSHFLRFRRKRVVVRLKGGDPYVFGRGGEEAEFLRKHRIPFEYVPGVTSAVAGPGIAGVPVTHRKSASSFTVVTAVGDYPWPRIDPKRPPGTLVVLMGAEGASDVSRRLLASGFARRTPVAAVRSATLQGERVTLTTLGGLARAKLKPPTVLVIGKVASRAARTRTRASGPLSGLRVAVARAEGHTGEAAALLRSLGARAEEVAVVRISPREGAAAPQGRFDALVFTSAEGVRRAADALGALGPLSLVKVFAIGPRTAAEVERVLGREALVPDRSSSAGLAKLILSRTDRGARLAAFRSSAASPELRRALERSGRWLVEVPVYDLRPAPFSEAAFRRSDAVITMASSCSRALARHPRVLRGKLVVAIGAQAAAPLRRRRDLELLMADRHDLHGAVATLLLRALARSLVRQTSDVSRTVVRRRVGGRSEPGRKRVAARS